jgi:uncharacterized protein
MAAPLMTAVITGSHSFDVPGFQHMLRSFPDVDAYPQDIDNLLADQGKTIDRYNAFVFYNMPRTAPDEKMAQAMQHFGETEQGMVIIHHALLGFADWPGWVGICGTHKGDNFSYHHPETVAVAIADAGHPITRGLKPFEIVDETYVMPDAAAGSHVLLTTTHPRSLHTIAWTRQYKKARVFCIALGHDGLAYENPSFRTLLERGIAWAAGRI